MQQFYYNKVGRIRSKRVGLLVRDEDSITSIGGDAEVWLS